MVDLNIHDQHKDTSRAQCLRATWSACLDRGTKDVRIQTVVISKFKLVDVQMQILFAHLMERAHDATLDDRPEAFDGVGVNGSADIFAVGMMDHTVRNSGIDGAIAFVVSVETS